jgi:hypothetical protein
MSRFSTKYGILDVSQPYRPLRSVTKIALLCFTLDEDWNAYTGFPFEHKGFSSEKSPIKCTMCRRIHSTCKIWGIRDISFEIFLRSVRRLLVAAGVVPSSPILVTLMKETLDSSESSVLTRATRRNFPEDTILLEIFRCWLKGKQRCIRQLMESVPGFVITSQSLITSS